jgi:two-component system, OmpR family, sensor histidine kinase KdpD
MAELDDRRPSPDALLALAAKDKRGKLKIFIGAAPGVGKTYAMLSGAQRLKGEGKDVVIGVVETHGRAETAALLSDLEVLPRKTITYRGHSLLEFDIDAALSRKPQLIIVDELAHTNAPESRHPKRYQDVEELLEAGINVWTALNIQHIESLSDVVATITGIKVRELVPDTVVEDAADVVMVDITPDELIQRLKEGKVYLPDNARRAADNFLQAGNLTALRELALRRTAERVDDQMVDYLRQHAIEGPWPTTDRILVCVGGDDSSERVVRQTARIAGALNATWVAVHASRPAEGVLDVEKMKRVDSNLDLAARLGAEVSRLTAKDLPTEVLRFADQENITQIIMGRSTPGFLKRFLGRSLSDEIMRQAHGVSVHILTDERTASLPIRLRRPRIELGGIAAAPLAVSTAVLVGLAADHFMKLPNLSMIFLAAVLFCAVTFGTWSAVIAAGLSFLAYNFFFIEPIYTFTIASPPELLALFFFLLVAILTGGLAGRVREQSVAAFSRVKQVETLFDLSRKLSASVKIDDLMWIVATQAAATANGQSIVLLNKDGELAIMAGMPPEDNLGPADWTAARWSLNHGEVAGWNSETLPNARFQYHPLKTPHGIAGVVGIRPNEIKLSAESQRMIEALLDQISIALERTILADEAADARASAEGEKLRSALLSSISHDLRTPLSSIVGSVTTLRSLDKKMTKPVRDDLLANIEEEASRLSRFVANLLDMTKIEGGAVRLGSEPIDVADVVASATRRARQTWPEREIATRSGPAIPPVAGDAALLEQLVFNLLDNANKYSPAGSPTTVSVGSEGNDVVLMVEDQGAGIPNDELERVFEKFYRVKGGDGRSPGTGLGLAICRGIARAMGGSIRAESPVSKGRGTRIVVRIPSRVPQ